MVSLSCSSHTLIVSCIIASLRTWTLQYTFNKNINMLLGAVLKSVLLYERYFWSYLLTVTYIENFKLAEKELYGIRCYIFTSEIRKPVLAVSVYLMKKKNDVLAFWLFVCFCFLVWRYARWYYIYSCLH